MTFLHGWPHLGLSQQRQLAHFATTGWRCIAPDLRGYGGSGVPIRVVDYSIREIVADMTELHDALSRPRQPQHCYRNRFGNVVCDTVHGRYADVMREDCARLTEVSIAAGHLLMLGQPVEVNRAI